MTATTTSPPRPAAPQGPSARRSWHLRANAVVLAYVAAALVALLLHGRLPVPRWLAVHLLLLGAATNAVVTWTEHFAVALLRARQPSRRLSAVRLVGLNVAVVGVLVGVAAGVAPVTVAGAGLLVVVVTGHSVSLWRTARRALTGRFAGTTRYYLAAGAALLVGVPLGAVIAVRPDDDRWHVRLHAAHVHANVLGWIGLTVLGTLFTLWPTVLRTRIADDVMATARRCLWLVGAGVAVVVASFLLGQRWGAVVGLLLYGGGVVLALQPFVRTWRRKAPTDAAAWSMAAGTGWLAIGVLADVVLLAVSADVGAYVERLDALVPVLSVGFVLQTLLGALTYLVPVIRGGGPTGVRATIDALSPGWRARVVALNVGVLVVAVAALAGLPSVVALAGWVLTAAPVALFLLLVVGAVLPESRRGPAGGVALGAVMTIVPLVVALSGQAPSNGPGTVTVAKATGVQQVAVTLADMDIRPGVIHVPAGTHLRLVVTNRDAMRHDLAFAAGPSTPMLAPGQHATLDLGVVTAPLSGWCTVAGHRAAGMTLDVTLTGSSHLAGRSGSMPGMAGTTGTNGDGTSSGGSSSDGSTLTTGTPALDVHGQPGAGWTSYDARLAPASRATTHRVTLHVVEKVVEVAPGVRQRIWTFGGTAPAPTLRGHVGDLFVVTVVNDGTMDHGIDFHAGETAPDDVMRPLAPGQSLVYRFRADHSGAWLYHCSTMPMAQHIANGMYGAVIIDPPGLARADREYVLVSSQLYLGTPDGGADAGRVAAGQWDAAELNGYPDQYVHAPLTAKVGERVRWWVVAAGPSEGIDFHVVGAQFDTVFKEGAYLLRPRGAEHGASQVLDLDPGQGGFVETVFPAAGHYTLVDHDMRRGEAGARGVMEVTR